MKINISVNYGYENLGKKVEEIFKLGKKGSAMGINAYLETSFIFSRGESKDVGLI